MHGEPLAPGCKERRRCQREQRGTALAALATMRNPMTRKLVFVCMIGALASCEGDQDSGGELVQPDAPIRALGTYLDAFHFYNGEIEQQVEAHHYVSELNDDVMQAVIFDGNGEDARLIGVEYIISQELFDQLPLEEKQLWHSHAFEVKSGMLIAPALSAAAEHQLMENVVTTYGKTWHTWHTHQDPVIPTGIPQLMMSFTADGQINQALLEDRDQRFGVDTQETAARRADIPYPAVDPDADAWTHGVVIQLEAVTQE
jgi:hypothetical protein